MSRRSPARVVAGFLALLLLLALSPASQAQKVFLKTTNPTGLPQEFLSQFVDMAVGPDGSSYYLFDLMGTRNNVVLDQTTFGFGRSLGTYVAKMSPSGDWLWAAAFEGNATKLDLRCLAVGTDFLVVGGSYVKSDAAQTATWKGSVGAAKVISPVDEPVLPVTPTTGGVDGMPQRVEQGLFLKLDLDG
ncbi:MAG: hypothetical protein JNL97_11125, partial [Verrucomicrobiales bacterium]|nr:hypothetical protein [Verrucomicrobiales bacterium]